MNIQKFGHCPSCGRCWACVKPNAVMFDQHNGCGVLCNKCWESLDTWERIRFHFEHWLAHAKWWERALAFIEWPVASWDRMRQALERDTAAEWTGFCQTCGEFKKIRLGDGFQKRCPVCERLLMPAPGAR